VRPHDTCAAPEDPNMAGDITLDANLPQSIEAEKSVLGAILLENSAINRAQELLAEGDFYREPHRLLFKVMSDLSERATPIDPVTVKEELARSGKLESVGGPAYIASLLDGVPHSSNVEHYAKIVKEKSILRRLIQAGGEMVRNAYEAAQDVDEILDRSERLVFEIAQDQMRSGFVPMRVIADQSLKTIERLSEHRELVTGLPTGFPTLNEMTSGLQPSDLVIIAARPGMGKTSFALNIAQHAAAREGRRVGVFSLEMSREQLFLRLLTGQARVDAHRLRTGRLGREEWARLTAAFGELSGMPISIDDTAGTGVMEMRAKSRRLKMEQGLDLLIIDYLQLMRGRGRFENRNQEISEISRSLKELAKELHLPVIAISQLSRAPEQRGSDRRPQLSDLRESGAIEQDADVVMFIYREEVYKPTEENRGRAQIIIAKQRNGPIGTIDLAFIREYTKFEELEWRSE
jgi:replicative DNA helicase